MVIIFSLFTRGVFLPLLTLFSRVSSCYVLAFVYSDPSSVLQEMLRNVVPILVYCYRVGGRIETLFKALYKKKRNAHFRTVFF